MGPMEAKSCFFCFLALSFCAVIVEMSPRHHHRHIQMPAPLFEADDDFDSSPLVAADDADSALKDAKAAAPAAKAATKTAKEAVAEANQAKAKQEQAKQEREAEAVPTVGNDFLNVHLTDTDVGASDLIDVDIDPTPVSKKTESKEVNEWLTHCYDGWKQYPCKLGFRYGCKNGICWSQCDAAWRFPLISTEWCWVSQPKGTNVGAADGSHWQYLDCKTDADCTKQFAYRRKCQSTCSLGKF